MQLLTCSMPCAECVQQHRPSSNTRAPLSLPSPATMTGSMDWRPTPATFNTKAGSGAGCCLRYLFVTLALSAPACLRLQHKRWLCGWLLPQQFPNELGNTLAALQFTQLNEQQMLAAAVC